MIVISFLAERKSIKPNILYLDIEAAGLDIFNYATASF